MTVRELLARIDSDEFSEWIAYERMAGPLDLGVRVDINAAMLAAHGYNLRRGRRSAKKVDEFLIKWDTAKARQSPEQMLAIAAGLNARMGGQDLRAPRS